MDKHSDVDVDVFEQAEDVQASNHNLVWSSLSPSAMLSLEEADQLLRWRDASIIAIVAERNSGKTTLITEIYGRFLYGPFAGACFCHSLSLLGFEKKSFQSRAKSGSKYPDTPRTSAQDGLHFFHLALSNECDLQRHDLLISERAGEAYRDIRNKPDQADDMVEIRKAKTVVFVIDGERVAAPRMRAEVFASVRNIIRAIVDTGNIAVQAQVQLVATKCDLLDGEHMEEAREALSLFEKTIIEMLAGKFDVTTFHTTARDPTAVVEPASGLAPLLISWLRPIPPVALVNLKMPELLNEFDRLLLRRFGL
ncbi:MAG: hypothetical protein WC024_12765 [Shewanella sp.]|jgi:hypothetical protein|uniref:TRAFAC clade GTPase domain-containing protein n=1 Tax=Shewanella sp. TaxID=50422 RepID=UPI00356717FA